MDSLRGSGFSSGRSIENVIEELSTESGLAIPEGIKDLDKKEILHKDVIEKEHMKDEVSTILIG